MAAAETGRTSKSRLPRSVLVASLVVLASIGAVYVPLEAALPSKYVIDRTLPFDTEAGGRYDDLLPGVSADYGASGFPLVLRPAAANFTTADELAAWIRGNDRWLQQKLHQHGAILLRGFSAVADPKDFETISLVLEPNLEEEYLGTSPRARQPGTRFVHSASEFPGWKVIPAHLEMSFKESPPRRQFFFAHAPNEGAGGETPIVDFRQVLRDMDPDVLERFKRGRLRYIRHYFDQDETPRGTWDVYMTKSWQAMFQTHDVSKVAETCAEEGFQWTWGRNSSSAGVGGILKLTHVMDPVRVHPATGEEVWMNHMNVFIIDNYPAEYAFSAQHLQSWTYVALTYAFEALVRTYKLVLGEENLGHYVTHTDGPMRADDIAHIRRLVWRNTLVYQHQKHDIVLLDNWRIGHGRQPYSGHRSLLTSWH